MKYPCHCPCPNHLINYMHVPQYIIKSNLLFRPPQRSATLPLVGGLYVSLTPRAMLAGASSPSRVTQARQVGGKRPDEAHSTGPPGWGLGWAINPVPSKGGCYRNCNDINRNNVVEEESCLDEHMTRVGENLREASAPTTLLTTKANTGIVTWNIRNLYETGKSAQICREMHRYNLMVLGLCETRWTGADRTRLTSGDTIYSRQEIGQPLMHEVALMMTSEATRALLSWKPVSPRILTARFNSKGRKVDNCV